MNRKIIIGALFITVGLLALPGVLDSLIIFIFVGKLPHSEIYLPLEAMFATYLALVILGVVATVRLGSIARDQRMTAAIRSSLNTIGQRDVKPKHSTKRSVSFKSKISRPKSRHRQSAAKA